MKLENFYQYLKINLDSANTKETYYSQMKCFFKHHKEFNQETINEYLAKKIDDGIAKRTFNIIVASFNHYQTFLKSDFEIPNYKKVGTSIKQYLTEKELHEEILVYFNRLFLKYEYYSFIVKILFYVGLRPKELCELQKENILFDEQLFLIKQTKNRKDKRVPFPKILENDIKKYLEQNGEKAFNIKYSQIYYIFNTVNKNLMYKKKLNPYILRHSYAHYCLDNGVPVEKLQLLMGHADLKTTMIYAQPSETEAINSYLKKIEPKYK